MFDGGFTTFLAILPSAFSASYLFRAQFNTLALVIFFGITQTLLVLPVVLANIGPPSLVEEDAAAVKSKTDSI